MKISIHFGILSFSLSLAGNKLAARDLAFAHTPHFGLGQNSVTIKRVGRGWVRTYHIETRTTKEFIPFWNKHTTVPLMRLVLYSHRSLSHLLLRLGTDSLDPLTRA